MSKFAWGVVAALAVFLAILTFGGCRPASSVSSAAVPPAGERRLVDREGNVFTIRGVPGRVISGAPSNTEIIAALGCAGRVIAADRYSAKVEGVASGIPQIDFFYPDAEVIISLEPDIIIANGYNRFGSGDDPFRLIRESGIAVAYIPMPDSIEGIYADITFIADVLGEGEKGAALVTAMRAEIDALRKTAEGVKQKRRVYFEISPAPDMVSLGKKTYLNEMIEITGGINIFGNEKGIVFPSAESVIERDPEVILTNVDYVENAGAEIRSRAGFDRIRAVRENNIFLIDADASSRPTQNIVKALRQMAAAIYPEGNLRPAGSAGDLYEETVPR